MMDRVVRFDLATAELTETPLRPLRDRTHDHVPPLDEQKRSTERSTAKGGELEGDQPAGAKVVPHHMLGHVPPAEAIQDECMLGRKVDDPPLARRQHPL